ncbi:MAG: ABC transporter substrate-binding protein [Chloroflexota bacterium]
MTCVRAPTKRVLGTLLVALLLAVAGALPMAASGRASAALAHSPGVLRISDEGSTTPSLEPAMVADDPWIATLVFSGLVGLDANLHVIGDGADTWRVSPDRRTYTFHIRPGLRLGNGTPVTADDFAWSLNRALTPKFANGNASYYLGNIKGAADVTARKAAWASGIKVLTQGAQKGWLQITLKQPSSVFLQQLTFPTSYVVPRARIALLGDAWTSSALGTGPFRVRSWRQKQELILEPNPYYWRGKLALRELHILLIDAEHAFEQYRLGNLDVMGAIAFPGDRLLKAQSIPVYHTQHLLLTDFLLPNVKRPPFDNVKIRQAFSYAINREALASTTLGGTVFPATGLLPPGLPGYNAALRGQVYDPARARKLLAQAGYPAGKGLPPTTLLVDNSSPIYGKESTALQAAWKATLGVTVTLARDDHTTYNDALSNRRFQIALTTWAADYPDPQDVLSLQLQTGASDNLGGYSNPTVDHLTQQADSMDPDSASRLPLYQQAEQVAVNEAAWIALDWGRSAVLIRPTVHGLVVSSWGVMAPDWTQVTAK